MFTPIFKKEIRISITLYPLLGGFVFCLFLNMVSTYIRAGNYEERYGSYMRAVKDNEDRLMEAKIYSKLKTWVIRKPRPMGILVNGIEEKVGDSTLILHGEAVRYLHQSLYSMDNPYLRIFSQIDLATIFQVVLSLFALLFSYGLISGDRELGGLKLTMANGVSRWSVILAKYAANAIVLLLMLLGGIIAGIIGMFYGLQYFSPWKVLSWERLLLFLFITYLYVSLFLAMGIFISTMTRRGSTSLIIALFLWVTLVIAYPKFIPYFVENAWSTEPESSVFERLSMIWKDYRDEMKSFGERIGIRSHDELIGLIKGEGKGGGGSSSLWGLGEWFQRDNIPGRIDPRVFQYIEFKERLAISCADRADAIWMDYLKRGPIGQARFEMNVMRISPAVSYYNASAIIAGTDLESVYAGFLDRIRSYRKELIRYLEDKGAFRSPKWFTTDFGPVDLSDMPRFRDTIEPAFSAFARAMPDILILFVMNIAFLIGSYVAFSRYDVR